MLYVFYSLASITMIFQTICYSYQIIRHYLAGLQEFVHLKSVCTICFHGSKSDAILPLISFWDIQGLYGKKTAWANCIVCQTFNDRQTETSIISAFQVSY